MSPSAPPMPDLATRLRSNLLQAPLFFLSTAAFGSFSLLISLFEKHGRLQHETARAWARVSLWIIGARVTVIGSEHLRAHTVAIYASNHTSFMDTPVVFSSLPFQFRILAKQSLWRWPFIGWHLNRSGQIPVEEDSAKGSIAGLNRAVKALRSGMPLFIFPEGGRTQDGSLQPFLNGPAFMAIRAQVPLVPMALVGTYELLPMNAKHFRPQPVKLVVGEPIPTTGYTLRQTDQLTARLRDTIEQLYREHARGLESRVEERAPLPARTQLREP